MTLPKGYKPNNENGDTSPTSNDSAKLLAIIIIVIIIAAIVGALLNGLNEESRKMADYANSGCTPSSWSYTGSPTTYMCPPGTSEDVGK